MVAENPIVEPNMKWIGRPLAEIWPFEIFSKCEVGRRSLHGRRSVGTPLNVAREEYIGCARAIGFLRTVFFLARPTGQGCKAIYNPRSYTSRGELRPMQRIVQITTLNWSINAKSST